MTSLSLSHEARFHFNLNGRIPLVFYPFNSLAFFDGAVFVLVAHGDDAVIAGDGIALASVVGLDAQPGGSAGEHFPVPPEAPAVHHQHWVPISRHTPLR